jgi:hypothetical protein
MKKPPLPEGIQEQVTLFLTDYPPREAQEIVSRYLGLVTSEKYRSASAAKLENQGIARSRPKARIRTQKINEPKTNQKSTSKSSRTRKINK